MSSNKTVHHQFHLWEPQDSILRTEFNENTEKTDLLFDDLHAYVNHCHQEAIGHTDAAVEDAKTDARKLADDLNAIKPNISMGSYMGNGSTAVRQIKLYHTPTLIFVCTQSGKTNVNGTVYGGLAGPGSPVRSADSGLGKMVIELNGRSLMVYGTNTDGCAANVSGVTYYYVIVY